MKSTGFTLTEMVVAAAVLALLFIISSMSWRRQLDKARDAQRKDDLVRIATALEEYQSDNNCYPEQALLQNYSGDELRPYLDNIPRDPTDNTAYYYLPDPDNPACPKNFRLLSRMQNEADPGIAAQNCDGDYGCGWGGNPVYNYGTASQNIPVANPDMPDSPPAPSAQPGRYACTRDGVCKDYGPNSCPWSTNNKTLCQSFCPTSPILLRCD